MDVVDEDFDTLTAISNSMQKTDYSTYPFNNCTESTENESCEIDYDVLLVS